MLLMRMMLLLFSFTVALLLDMRRRLKAAMDVLDSMISCGVTLARSVELTSEWDKILSIGAPVPCYFGLSSCS